MKLDPQTRAPTLHLSHPRLTPSILATVSCLRAPNCAAPAKIAASPLSARAQSSCCSWATKPRRASWPLLPACQWCLARLVRSSLSMKRVPLWRATAALATQ